MVDFQMTSGYEAPGSIRGRGSKFQNLIDECLKLKPDSNQYKEFEFSEDTPENASAALYGYVAEHKREINWRFTCRKRGKKTLRVYKVTAKGH